MEEQEIAKLIVSKLERAVESTFLLQKQSCVNMDKMGGLYIPLSCRD